MIKRSGAGVEGGTEWGGYGLNAGVELNKTTLKEYTRRTSSSLPRSGRRSPLVVIIDSIIVRSSTTYDVRMIITIATTIPSTTQGA